MIIVTALLLAASLLWFAEPFGNWSLRRPTRHPGTTQIDVWTIVIDTISTGIRAGAAPALACAASCRAVSRLSPQDAPEVEILRAAADAGSDLGTAWQAIADGADDAGLRSVAAAWRLSESVGAPLADALAVAARQRRDELERLARSRAALAAPRASVNLLTALPIGGALLSVLMGVDVLSVYLSALAVVTIVPGVLLILLGRLWCRRLINRATRTKALAEVGR